MLTSHVIQKSITELNILTKTNIGVFDEEAKSICTAGNIEIAKNVVESFAKSPADSQVISDYHLFKVYEDSNLLYVIVTSGQKDTAYTVGKIAISQLQQLMVAYQEKYDKNSFYQNLILDNMLLVDIYNRAKKLHIDPNLMRAAYLIEADKNMNGIISELLKGMFVVHGNSAITSVDEDKVILIKAFDTRPSSDEMTEVAEMIVSLINTEAMTDVKVAYGNVVTGLKDVSRSYKEAKLALEVSNIFSQEKKIASYSSLGIGRLIYQLPINLCEMFIEEVFGDGIPAELDEETITMLNKFFENNLNVSHTSEQLYLHRNTIIYRIEKVQKATGLNLREFEDALTYKIAMMVKQYLDYVKKEQL